MASCKCFNGSSTLKSRDCPEESILCTCRADRFWIPDTFPSINMNPFFEAASKLPLNSQEWSCLRNPDKKQTPWVKLINTFKCVKKKRRYWKCHVGEEANAIPCICSYQFLSIWPHASQIFVAQLNLQPCGKEMVSKQQRLVGNYIIVLCETLICSFLCDKRAVVLCVFVGVWELLVLNSQIKKKTYQLGVIKLYNILHFMLSPPEEQPGEPCTTKNWWYRCLNVPGQLCPLVCARSCPWFQERGILCRQRVWFVSRPIVLTFKSEYASFHC